MDQSYQDCHLYGSRNPGGDNSDVNALPLGFIERTSNKGMARVRWAPQIGFRGTHQFGVSFSVVRELW
jgi:hypothetical protein